MRTELGKPRFMALCCVAVLLAGCQASAPPPPSPVQFQVTNLGDPTQTAPVTAVSGTELDFPAVFDIEVRLTGIDPASVQDLKMLTTAYTPQCNSRPIDEPYRTKVINYPYGVTGAPPTPTSPGFMMPLSSRTLMELGQCVPRMPLGGDVHLQAQLLDSSNVWSRSDLILHIAQPEAAKDED